MDLSVISETAHWFPDFAWKILHNKLWDEDSSANSDTVRVHVHVCVCVCVRVYVYVYLYIYRLSKQKVARRFK